MMISLEKSKALASRREVLLGTNQYPNTSEVMASAIDAAKISKQAPVAGDVEPIRLMRGAEEFEALRLATEKASKRPKVFMLTYGNLAMRSLKQVLPPQEECPYTIRVVSDILESNGSSSMATVCAGTLALMDAGVKIKAPVSGIAMGLITDGKRFKVLSDILGDEDHLGDMDFKVAGTSNGITALQMDIKVTGITFAIMEKALAQAKQARLHILEQMNKVLATPREELNEFAPMLATLRIKPEKIREVIGSGGKVIRDICEKSESKIDIEDDGLIRIFAPNNEKLKLACQMIEAIAIEPEVGKTYDAVVVKITEYGAFVDYLGSNSGLVHVSEIADTRVDNVRDHLTEGQKIKVKLVGIDDRGKARLSIKAVGSSE